MVVRSSPAANILDILVLMYKNFENYTKIHEKNEPPCWRIIIYRIIYYPDISG